MIDAIKGGIRLIEGNTEIKIRRDIENFRRTTVSRPFSQERRGKMAPSGNTLRGLCVQIRHTPQLTSESLRYLFPSFLAFITLSLVCIQFNRADVPLTG